jgi:hypothetical protein
MCTRWTASRSKNRNPFRFVRLKKFDLKEQDQMSNPLLKKSFIAGASGITPNSIVKFSGAGTVVLGAGATDLLLGVTDDFCNPNSGDRLDVMLIGIAMVKTAGAITRGNLVTSNGAGLGVVSATTDRAIGIALETAASGDIIPVLLSPSLNP